MKFLLCFFCVICHNFTFHILQGNVATFFGCGRNYYISFFGHLVLFPEVKKYFFKWVKN